MYGQIADTNSQFISSKLDKIGIRLIQQTSIGEILKKKINALQSAEKRVDIVLITGGLRPTKDGITKNVFYDFLDSQLVFHQEVLDNITRIFKYFNEK